MSIWKQFIGLLVRLLFAWLFGVLVSKSIISRELADKLTESATGYAVLAIIALVPIVWGYLKLRFNKYLVLEARAASPLTPVSEIKAETLKRIQGGLSV